ncbi:MAG TPA: hypothetical protein VMQ99_06695, partial [Acetobacteraceae bacterium]|nr:hypothetical protein [Acetobacteraceae bacterium]
EARAVAAAEAAACAEDRQIVAAAYKAGKFPASRIEFWTDALKRDRERNRAVVASLAVGIFPPEKIAVDTDLEQIHNKVLGKLGLAPTPQAPRSVAASSSPVPAARESLRDMLGQPTSLQPPDPVLLSKGTNPDDWTWQQKSDFFQRHILGGKFAVGTRPTPQVGDTYYFPSPNDPYEYVDSQWREKNPYKEIP